MNVLICDLDGTLIDSAPDMAAAVADLLAEAGRPPLPLTAVQAMVGDGLAKLVERALAAAGGVPDEPRLAALTARYRSYYEARMTELTQPYPGVLETLSGLRADGWRLAVCTNKPEGQSRRILSALGLDTLFEAVAGGDTYPVKKPDPAHVHGILRVLNAAPSQAVMLGDSFNDVAAGRGAGLPVIAVSHGYGPVPARALGADAVIDAFAELPAALKRIVQIA